MEWIGNPGTRHCWNGTPSIAAALATLGEAADADYGQVWHLPTYGPMTGYESCEVLGEVCGCEVAPRAVTPTMMRALGVVNRLGDARPVRAVGVRGSLGPPRGQATR